MKNDTTTTGVRINNPNLKVGVTQGKGLSAKPTKVRYDGNYKEHTIGILKLFFIIMISIVVIRFLYSGNDTYTSTISLLEMLQDLPSISTSFKSFAQKAIITADIYPFNWFKDLVNSFTSLWSILMWISGALIDVLLFISSFIRYLFV